MTCGNYFLRSAILQGCPLSSAIKILAPIQRQRKEITGIRFEKEETKILLFVQSYYILKNHEIIQINYYNDRVFSKLFV